ncbi:MAG: ThiF family adenylyltransferase [Candidatus Helarchaeota archaeon]
MVIIPLIFSLEEVPFTIAGVLRFEGQIFTFLPKNNACYRCVFIEIPDQRYIPICNQLEFWAQFLVLLHVFKLPKL